MSREVSGVDGPVSYDLMAQDTTAFIQAVVGGPAPGRVQRRRVRRA
jgi:hypothetical protein